MGFVLTAFVNGTVMNAATLTANITTIKNWLNGGIATGDIVNGSVKARHLRALEHYLSGTANPRSDGVTGTTLRRAYTSDPAARAYVTPDSHGIGIWEDVSTCAHRWYARDSGIAECVFEFWAWAIQSDETTPEAKNICDFRLKLNGTAVTATEITLFDAGQDSTAQDSGPFSYCARNLPFLFQRSISAGWNNVKLQVKVANQGTAAADIPGYCLVIIGARNLHVEYWDR
jgi:hypothetical protein